jgi:hypothetical protein
VSYLQRPALSHERQGSAKASARYNDSLLDSGALQEGAQNLIGLEELAGDFAGGEGVAGVIGVDAFHGLGGTLRASIGLL